MKTQSKNNHTTAKKTSATKSKSPSEDSDVAKGLQELFEAELKDIYWAEKTLVKALPKMIKKATSPELADSIQKHLAETEGQVTRLEQVFELMGKKAQAKKCEAMAGLVKEAGEIMEETEEGPVRDAGIISAAQKVEHYEIASYGTLCSFAYILGMDKAVKLLQQTLDEEKAADEKLTEVAESAINMEAVNNDSENEK